jgi:cell division septal protein FtsQ
LTLGILLFDWLLPTFNKMSGFMVIKEIDVEIINQTSSLHCMGTEKIRNELKSFIGESLYSLDKNKIIKKISGNPKNYQWIKRIILTRRIPSTIKIGIELKEAKYIFSNGEMYYLDEKGEIIVQVVSPQMLDLPIISGKRENFAEGENIEKITKIEKRLSQDGYLVSEIFVDDMGFYNFLLAGQKYLLKFSDINFDEQYERFKIINDDLKTRKIKSAEIDLTFDSYGTVKRLT